MIVEAQFRNPNHGAIAREVFTCPYGEPGDRLWVKEAWSLPQKHDDKTPNELWQHLTERGQGVTVFYRENGAWADSRPSKPFAVLSSQVGLPDWCGRIRSSMFMPRWASRTLLEIKEIRAERVQSISREDAIAEGMNTLEVPIASLNGEPATGSVIDPRVKYAFLWDNLNGDRDGGKLVWRQNPWCWVIVFERIQ